MGSLRSFLMVGDGGAQACRAQAEGTERFNMPFVVSRRWTIRMNQRRRTLLRYTSAGVAVCIASRKRWIT